MPNFYVKYKVGSGTNGTIMSLPSASESAAIAKLKAQQSVPKNAEVIILEIKPS